MVLLVNFCGNGYSVKSGLFLSGLVEKKQKYQKKSHCPMDNGIKKTKNLFSILKVCS